MLWYNEINTLKQLSSPLHTHFSELDSMRPWWTFPGAPPDLRGVRLLGTPVALCRSPASPTAGKFVQRAQPLARSLRRHSGCNAVTRRLKCSRIQPTASSKSRMVVPSTNSTLRLKPRRGLVDRRLAAGRGYWNSPPSASCGQVGAQLDEVAVNRSSLGAVPVVEADWVTRKLPSFAIKDFSRPITRSGLPGR